jgi:peroxiredoxin family protein/TusA-related sulfurtransferase
MKTYKEMKKIKDEDILEVQATDPGFKNDIKKWAEKTGNTLISIETKNSTIYSRIKKGNNKKNTDNFSEPQKDGQTMVVFSNDFDKAIATFVIANGATAMGKKVSLFFTFWGLSILRKETFSSKNKNFIEKFFGFALPNGINKLKMSKMNMFGIGPKVMKNLMQKKKIESLEKMMITAKENGVKFIACQMSMDLMGIKKEELIDGIEIGGVATYLSQAEDSNLNLFI